MIPDVMVWIGFGTFVFGLWLAFGLPWALILGGLSLTVVGLIMVWRRNKL